jgi:epoxyqueuosine reductase
VKFAQETAFEEFRPRELFADTQDRDGTRALARELLMMGPAEYAAAFKGSAMKRAKLWMLQRNACVVLGNVGTDEDLAVLDAMREHEHVMVQDVAAWAIRRIAAR